MLRLGFSGALGRMNQEIIHYLMNYSDKFLITGLWEKHTGVQSKALQMPGDEKIPYSEDINVFDLCDVIIDFSHPANLDSLYQYIISHPDKKLICGTTGFGKPDYKKLKQLGNVTAVFYSPNMSYGLNVLLEILPQFTKYFPDWDIEAMEVHHKHKKDAPSGTMMKILETIRKNKPDFNEVYDRHSRFQEKKNNEIGISSLRIGGVKGIHRLFFGNEFETIEIAHEALDRKVFASGVLEALFFITNKAKGFYSFHDLLEEKNKK